MVVILKGKGLRIMALVLTLTLFAGLLGIKRLRAVSAEEYDFMVFVAGIGTVMGKWSGSTGIAVIGVGTEPGREEGQELKVIDLLIANNSPVPVQFCSEINLIDKRNKRYGLTSKGQPEVIIGPGAFSQGTVIIGVPAKVPDKDWRLEIRGGNLEKNLLLPLRVVKAAGDMPAGRQ